MITFVLQTLKKSNFTGLSAFLRGIYTVKENSVAPCRATSRNTIGKNIHIVVARRRATVNQSRNQRFVWPSPFILSFNSQNRVEIFSINFEDTAFT
jgi:uncharacterized protein YccT (UPF0319 family)